MKESYSVLIVEDDPDDQFLIKLAFEQESSRFKLQFASDGRLALDTIEGMVILPDLILLDLNMPKVNGFEVLSKLKQSDRYRHVPIVILTTSSAITEIKQAYWLGANTFLTKPNSQNELWNLVRQIRTYWFELAKTPSI